MKKTLFYSMMITAISAVPNVINASFSGSAGSAQVFTHAGQGQRQTSVIINFLANSLKQWRATDRANDYRNRKAHKLIDSMVKDINELAGENESLRLVFADQKANGALLRLTAIHNCFPIAHYLLDNFDITELDFIDSDNHMTAYDYVRTKRMTAYDRESKSFRKPTDADVVVNSNAEFAQYLKVKMEQQKEAALMKDLQEKNRQDLTQKVLTINEKVFQKPIEALPAPQGISFSKICDAIVADFISIFKEAPNKYQSPKELEELIERCFFGASYDIAKYAQVVGVKDQEYLYEELKKATQNLLNSNNTSLDQGCKLSNEKTSETARAKTAASMPSQNPNILPCAQQKEESDLASVARNRKNDAKNTRKKENRRKKALEEHSDAMSFASQAKTMWDVHHDSWYQVGLSPLNAKIAVQEFVNTCSQKYNNDYVAWFKDHEKSADTCAVCKRYKQKKKLQRRNSF